MFGLIFFGVKLHMKKIFKKILCNDIMHVYARKKDNTTVNQMINLKFKKPNKYKSSSLLFISENWKLSFFAPMIKNLYCKLSFSNTA